LCHSQLVKRGVLGRLRTDENVQATDESANMTDQTTETLLPLLLIGIGIDIHFLILYLLDKLATSFHGKR
jgi:hypothetical protein